MCFGGSRGGGGGGVRYIKEYVYKIDYCRTNIIDQAYEYRSGV